LRDTIYPFRKAKLIDFLAIYTEIDLVKEYRTKSSADPAIQAQIAAGAAELLAARLRVEKALNEKIEARKEVDTYFKRITGSDERSLRFQVHLLPQPGDRPAGRPAGRP
jgi:hypothetical protein